VHRNEVHDAIKRQNDEVAEEFSAGRKVACKQITGVVVANTDGNVLVKWETGLTIAYTPKLVESMGIIDIGVAE
jgi:hypothetical protein